jgi:hypothetical protein
LRICVEKFELKSETVSAKNWTQCGAKWRA